MPSETKLTRRSALFFGLICIAASLIPILAGLGMIPIKPTQGTPGWVGVAAGVAFLFAGLVLMSNAVNGVLGPNGQMLETAPAWVKSFQWLMGLAIVTSLASVTSWVAFGPGERHFQSSVSLPFITMHPKSGDSMGRWMFGFMAVLMWCMVCGALVSAARKRFATKRSSGESSGFTTGTQT